MIKKIKFAMQVILTLAFAVPAYSGPVEKVESAAAIVSLDKYDLPIASEITRVAMAPVIAQIQTPLPEVTDDIFDKTPDGNVDYQTLMWIGVGCLLYWILRFKGKDAAASFDIGKWFQGNWFKLILYLVGIVIIGYLRLHLNKFVAIGLGLSPQFVIDWVKKMLNKAGANIE